MLVEFKLPWGKTPSLPFCDKWKGDVASLNFQWGSFSRAFKIKEKGLVVEEAFSCVWRTVFLLGKNRQDTLMVQSSALNYYLFQKMIPNYQSENSMYNTTGKVANLLDNSYFVPIILF
ncbi:hypothetical protein DsansV1_C11g0111031 [Dioscorea sansibarensis]